MLEPHQAVEFQSGILIGDLANCDWSAIMLIYYPLPLVVVQGQTCTIYRDSHPILESCNFNISATSIFGLTMRLLV
jgi:hypothetical protein